MSQGQDVVAPKLPIPELRDFARVQVEEVGLRPAARRSGITPTGLRTFVNGTDPRNQTRRKLEIWYWRTHAAARSESTGAGEVAAVLYLLRCLPSHERARAAARVLDEVESVYDETGEPLPWPRGLTCLATEERDRSGHPHEKKPGRPRHRARSERPESPPPRR